MSFDTSGASNVTFPSNPVIAGMILSAKNTKAPTTGSPSFVTSTSKLSLSSALNVSPRLLLPDSSSGTSPSWVTEKMPEGTEKEITEWAGKLVGE